MARVPADATAFAHRDAIVMASVIAHGEAPYEDGQGVCARPTRRTSRPVHRRVLELPRRGGRGAAARQAYPGATYERLVQVKRRVDPENVFHGNHNIRPD